MHALVWNESTASARLASRAAARRFARESTSITGIATAVTVMPSTEVSGRVRIHSATVESTTMYASNRK